MTDQTLLSQANSTQRMLFNTSATITSPFKYRLGVNLPSFVHHLPVKSTKTSAEIFYPGYVSYDIPRHGLLNRICMRVEYKAVARGAAGAEQIWYSEFPMYSALANFSEFRLYTRDKFIATLMVEDLLEHLSRQNSHKREMILSPTCLGEARANYEFMDGLADATARVAELQKTGLERSYHLPTDTDRVFEFELPFSFTEKLSSALYTKFSEPIELRCYTKTLPTDFERSSHPFTITRGANAAADNHGATWNLELADFINPTLPSDMPGARAIGSRLVTLTPERVSAIFHFITPAPEEEEQMRKAMSDSVNQEGIATLQTSSISETLFSITSSVAEQVIPLKAPYPVFRTCIMIQVANKDGHADTKGRRAQAAVFKPFQSTIFPPGCPIESISLMAAGQTLRSWTISQLNELNNSFQHRRKILAPKPHVRRKGLGHLHPASDPSEDIIVIPWNLSDVSSDQTNFLSIKNLSEPSIAIKFAPGKLEYLLDYTIKVWHNYYQITQIAPADGMVRCRILN